MGSGLAMIGTWKASGRKRRGLAGGRKRGSRGLFILYLRSSLT